MKMRITRDFDIECGGEDLLSILKDGYYHAEHRETIPIPLHAKVKVIIPSGGAYSDMELELRELRCRITWRESEE